MTEAETEDESGRDDQGRLEKNNTGSEGESGVADKRDKGEREGCAGGCIVSVSPRLREESRQQRWESKSGERKAGEWRGTIGYWKSVFL